MIKDTFRTPTENREAKRIVDTLALRAWLVNWPRGKVGAIRGMNLDPAGLSAIKANQMNQGTR